MFKHPVSYFILALTLFSHSTFQLYVSEKHWTFHLPLFPSTTEHPLASFCIAILSFALSCCSSWFNAFQCGSPKTQHKILFHFGLSHHRVFKVRISDCQQCLPLWRISSNLVWISLLFSMSHSCQCHIPFLLLAGNFSSRTLLVSSPLELSVLFCWCCC